LNGKIFCFRKLWAVRRYLEEVGLEGFEKVDLAALGFESDDLHHETAYNNAMTQVNEGIVNDEEDYLSDIENGFQPHLKSMLDGDTSFYEDDKKLLSL
jgi:hypothetical protein